LVDKFETDVLRQKEFSKGPALSIRCFAIWLLDKLHEAAVAVRPEVTKMSDAADELRARFVPFAEQGYYMLSCVIPDSER
jgi:hypothetical protein